MNTRVRFRAAIEAFNREDWDDALDRFSDLEGETQSGAEENLIEAMTCLTRAYAKVHGGDIADPLHYDQARYEAQQALEHLEEGLPETVLGIRTHNLEHRVEQFLEAVGMNVSPPTFRIELPPAEHSDSDSEAAG
ncbi:MAG: hypothetical protein KIT79_15985 [Deltaproteobacteria bacterium]|nr:hypothetical protein [Deltaproteobacteria bacterium]